MSTQMTTPEQAPAQTIQPTHSRSIFDDMVENHQARAQAEQAKADKICAETYANNANAYVIALGRDYGLAELVRRSASHIPPASRVRLAPGGDDGQRGALALYAARRMDEGCR
jgi:hypothetical protein